MTSFYEKRWRMEMEYRYKNKIRGKCYYLNSLVPEKLKQYAFKKGVLCPSGICVSTAKKYFIQEDPMGWDILFMTDDEDLFNEVTKNHYAGEKGLLRDLNCWDVLAEMQMEGGDHYEFDYAPLVVQVRLCEKNLIVNK